MGRDPSTPLTSKQQRFVEEYLVDLNATQAAVRAGYSARTAKEIGSQLLVDPGVGQAVRAAKAERSARTNLQADQVLVELARIAFLDPAECFDPHGALLPMAEIPEHARRAIASHDLSVVQGDRADAPQILVLRTRVRFLSKLHALELLARHLGLFEQRAESAVLDALERIARESWRSRPAGNAHHHSPTTDAATSPTAPSSHLRWSPALAGESTERGDDRSACSVQACR